MERRRSLDEALKNVTQIMFHRAIAACFTLPGHLPAASRLPLPTGGPPLAEPRSNHGVEIRAMRRCWLRLEGLIACISLAKQEPMVALWPAADVKYPAVSFSDNQFAACRKIR
ncbi:MAG TPA: hypothetical protein VIW27_05080 [Gammaproteobacteria bacterium]|jgi:hypothetical protein